MAVDSSYEFEGWAILELMGHRKLGGFVRMNGPLMRIDVHDADKPLATQWYGAHALYCLTPTTEDVARRLAHSARPEPVTVWELETEAEKSERLTKERTKTSQQRLAYAQQGEFDEIDDNE